MKRTLAMIVTAGLAATTATAQGINADHQHGNERTIVEVLQGQRTSDDVRSVDVVIRDGDVTVRVNGERLADEDVRRTSDGVVEYRWNGTWRSTHSASAPEPPAGGARRVTLGVVPGEVNEALAAQLGIDPQGSVLIQRVVEGSAAEKAGIERFDVLTGFAGETDVNLGRLRELLSEQSPGDEVHVTVLRGGETKRLVVGFPVVEGTVSRLRAEAPQAPTPPQPKLRFFGTELDEEARVRLQETLRRAEAQAERAQAQAKRLTLRLQNDLQPLQQLSELKELKSLDGEARQKIEKAMAQLEETLGAYDFDFDFDFDVQFEDLPRMKFLELENEEASRLRKGHPFDGRAGGERAVILEKREQELRERREEARERGLERREREMARRGAESEAQIERLEQRMERMERLLERLIERMEREGQRPRQ